MGADYGFEVSRSGADRVITVRARQSAMQKMMRSFIFLAVPLMLAFGCAIDSGPTGRGIHEVAGTSWEYTIVAAFLGIIFAVMVWFLTTASSTELRLTKEAIRAGTMDYDKSDIVNLGVQSPNSPVITSRSELGLNFKVGAARQALSTEFAVVFDYGMDHIQLAKHLSEPQAHALAREIDSWLVA